MCPNVPNNAKASQVVVSNTFLEPHKAQRTH